MGWEHRFFPTSHNFCRRNCFFLLFFFFIVTEFWTNTRIIIVAWQSVTEVREYFILSMYFQLCRATHPDLCHSPLHTSSTCNSCDSWSFSILHVCAHGSTTSFYCCLYSFQRSTSLSHARVMAHRCSSSSIGIRKRNGELNSQNCEVLWGWQVARWLTHIGWSSQHTVFCIHSPCPFLSERDPIGPSRWM